VNKESCLNWVAAGRTHVLLLLLEATAAARECYCWIGQVLLEGAAGALLLLILSCCCCWRSCNCHASVCLQLLRCYCRERRRLLLLSMPSFHVNLGAATNCSYLWKLLNCFEAACWENVHVVNKTKQGCCLWFWKLNLPLLSVVCVENRLPFRVCCCCEEEKTLPVRVYYACVLLRSCCFLVYCCRKRCCVFNYQRRKKSCVFLS